MIEIENLDLAFPIYVFFVKFFELHQSFLVKPLILLFRTPVTSDLDLKSRVNSSARSPNFSWISKISRKNYLHHIQC